MNASDYHVYSKPGRPPVVANLPDMPHLPNMAEQTEFCCNSSEFLPENPALNSLLEDVCERGSHAIEPISTHICALQEMFLDALYNKLNQGNINLSEKLTIYLNRENRLAVLGEHPEKANIEKLLADAPALADVFTTLSFHSEIAKEIININRIFHALHGGNSPCKDNVSGYHLSLRGGMSHFYFV